MIACEGGRCRVDGPLTIENITAVLDESERLFAAPENRRGSSAVTEVIVGGELHLNAAHGTTGPLHTHSNCRDPEKPGDLVRDAD